MKEKNSKYEQLRKEVEELYQSYLEEHNRTSGNSEEYFLTLEKMTVAALILTRMLELDEETEESK